MGPRNGLITQTGDRVQQDRRAHRTPLLLGARLAEALQHALLVLAEDQKPTSPLKGHAPLKHRWGHVYSYLENTHLGPGFSAGNEGVSSKQIAQRLVCAP